MSSKYTYNKNLTDKQIAEIKISTNPIDDLAFEYNCTEYEIIKIRSENEWRTKERNCNYCQKIYTPASPYLFSCPTCNRTNRNKQND